MSTDWTLALSIALAIGGGLWLLWFSAHYTWWRRPKPAPWPRLLMYHRVDPAREPSGMNVTPEQFDQQLTWLAARGARFVTVSEMVSRPAPNQVAITFDDGYGDNCLHALPVLQRHGAKATVYLAPELDDPQKLTPAQIEQMQLSGLIEFGAHTLHHVNLTTLEDAEAEREIAGSKQAVEALTGVPCLSFSYPFGRFEARHVAMVQTAGFANAVTVKKRILPAEMLDPFRLPRIGIGGQMRPGQFRLAVTRGRYRL